MRPNRTRVLLLTAVLCLAAVAFVGVGTRVVALDPSGEERWRYAETELGSAVALVDDLLVTTHDRTVTALRSVPS